jgi:hypothetical protein
MSRPVLILGLLFLLTAVYLFFGAGDGVASWQVGLILGISLIAVDLEFNKLKVRLEKLETPLAPPVTEEG